MLYSLMFVISGLGVEASATDDCVAKLMDKPYCFGQTQAKANCKTENSKDEIISCYKDYFESGYTDRNLIAEACLVTIIYTDDPKDKSLCDGQTNNSLPYKTQRPPSNNVAR